MLNLWGAILTILSQDWDASMNLAILGPKYSIKVWRPVPRPIEDKIPNPIQYIANNKNLSNSSKNQKFKKWTK